MIVVDVGCGPARLRALLPPDLEYFGFDPNPDYIANARRTTDGTFSVGTMNDFMQAYGEALAGRVDLVTCMGVLHHVSPDEMDEILFTARRLLRPGGRFVALEPVLLAWQDAASRWVVGQDRGTSILDDVEWRELLDRHFPRAQVRVTTHLLRIPYTHALLTAWAD
jgi:SAM-dependent methyltransferase